MDLPIVISNALLLVNGSERPPADTGSSQTGFTSASAISTPNLNEEIANEDTISISDDDDSNNYVHENLTTSGMGPSQTGFTSASAISTTNLICNEETANEDTISISDDDDSNNYVHENLTTSGMGPSQTGFTSASAISTTNLICNEETASEDTISVCGDDEINNYVPENFTTSGMGPSQTATPAPNLSYNRETGIEGTGSVSGGRDNNNYCYYLINVPPSGMGPSQTGFASASAIPAPNSFWSGMGTGSVSAGYGRNNFYTSGMAPSQTGFASASAIPAPNSVWSGMGTGSVSAGYGRNNYVPENLGMGMGPSQTGFASASAIPVPNSFWNWQIGDVTTGSVSGGLDRNNYVPENLTASGMGSSQTGFTSASAIPAPNLLEKIAGEDKGSVSGASSSKIGTSSSATATSNALLKIPKGNGKLRMGHIYAAEYSFFKWAAKERVEVLKLYPNMKNAQLMKFLGARWRDTFKNVKKENIKGGCRFNDLYFELKGKGVLSSHPKPDTKQQNDPFILWRKQESEKIMKAYPEMPLWKQERVLRFRWNGLSQAEKKSYKSNDNDTEISVGNSGFASRPSSAIVTSNVLLTRGRGSAAAAAAASDGDNSTPVDTGSYSSSSRSTDNLNPSVMSTASSGFTSATAVAAPDLVGNIGKPSSASGTSNFLLPRTERTGEPEEVPNNAHGKLPPPSSSPWELEYILNFLRKS